MTEYTDVEIGIHQHGSEGYYTEIRFTNPEDENDSTAIAARAAQFDQDFKNALREQELDPLAYGQTLSDTLFCDPQIRTMFGQCVTATETKGMMLRVRLFIGASATELHPLRWETLNNPLERDPTPLAMSERILFSRYLGSIDWRSVRLRPRSDLRTLVVIANPVDLDSPASGEPALAPVDVAAEQAIVAEALGETIPVTFLASGGTATLPNIIHHLQEQYDILYIIAHGAFLKNTPYIWLEQEDGTRAVTPGKELVSALRDVRHSPRMIVLASCQSAGKAGDVGSPVLAALGPQLAEAGVPSVVAMQDNVSMATNQQFMACFFQELLRDGQIDRAIAVARREVSQRHDWWIPVLFTRLKSGRIWYVPGFSDEKAGFDKLPALLRSIKRGSCTPILGPHLTQTLLETPRDIARNWAEQYHFPLAIDDRDNLPQVAQYLAINQDQQFPRDELLEYLRRQLLINFANHFNDDMEEAYLDELFAKVGEIQRAKFPDNPYKVLAELPFPVYVTTNLSNLLDEALVAAGKEPRIELCRWNDYLDSLPSIYDDEPDFRPDVDNPLVYHLFGRCDEPDSLVLTEDDYFDFLIGVTSNKDLIPSVVRRALADTALVFLGFEVDNWDFRVLFRSIMSQEGSSRRRRYAHVAAQIDPEETRILQPERARAYLESYFQGADISIFWGTVEDFVQELLTNLS